MVSQKHNMLAAGLCAVVAAAFAACHSPLGDSKPFNEKLVGRQMPPTEWKSTPLKDISAARTTFDEAQHGQFDALLDREHRASHGLIELGMSSEDHVELHKELDAKHSAFHARLKQPTSVQF